MVLGRKAVDFSKLLKLVLASIASKPFSEGPFEESALWKHIQKSNEFPEISRTPIRRALKYLVDTEKLMRLPDQRYRHIDQESTPPSTEMTKQHLRELILNRAVIEEFTVSEYARNANLRIDPLIEIHQKMHSIAVELENTEPKAIPAKLDTFLKLDREFHRLIAYNSGFPKLAKELEEIREALHRAQATEFQAENRILLYAFQCKEVVDEHWNILEAIRPSSLVGVRGIPEKAINAMKEHLTNSARRWNFQNVFGSTIDETLDPNHRPKFASNDVWSYALEAVELISIRAVIELMIVRKLVASKVSLSSVETVLAEAKRTSAKFSTLSSNDYKRKEVISTFMHLDIAFHSGLAFLADYSFLERTLINIWIRTYQYNRKQLLTNSERMNQVCTDHEAILQAIKKARMTEAEADKSAAIKLMNDHLIQSNYRNFQLSTDATPDYSEAMEALWLIREAMGNQLEAKEGGEK